jgi:murein L,D-transpeptidase YafK
LTFIRRFFALSLVLVVAVALSACGGLVSKGDSKRSIQPLKASAVEKMTAMGTDPKQGTLIRIFKESSELEVWKRTAAGGYKLFDTYAICAWAGELGPKIKEGDRQSPEGFYNITPGLMNPNSSYYLAFNTGYPNKFDRANGRTGSLLMVHGDCSSRGCYSMTDEAMAEIYAIVRESFSGGNATVQLQIYPFRMTPQNMAKHADSPHFAFWQNIKEGYDRFELAKSPPAWDVCEKRYTFDVDGAQSLEAVATCPGRRPGDTLVAALTQKQAADNATMDSEIATLGIKKAKADDAAKKAAETEAALKARGEAIGNFVGGIVGGGQQQPAPAAAGGTVDPKQVAPVPAPPIKRI